ncbi:restriction endonuclease subunit S [Methanolobus sp. WCC1]|uniref:restriction endonuclease subunit S n=1 Tax=unclassified Methanolobus TaxID=2629569 RepID=UPI003254BA3B
MTGEWKKFKIGDIVTLEYGKGLKNYKDGDGNYDVFGTNGKIGFANEFLYDKPSVIIGRKGAYREVHLAKKPFFVIDTAFYTKMRIKKLNNLFLYYWFKNIDINDMDSGSAIPSTSRDEIYDLDIFLPPISEQRAITSVLSSLDDKIDLLHCQNKTFEAMAETLFRQWFVEEADEGWEEKPLSKVADFLNGLACQKYPPQNDVDKLPVLKIKELRNGFSKNSDYATTEVKPEYLVKNGDVVFSWSASLMVKVWDGGKCILNQHLFKVTSEAYPKWFYYQWCKYYLEEFVSISASHATTMGHIKRGDLDVAMVLVPSNDELKEMTKSMAPLMDKLIVNNKQIRTLEKLRDTLLPKLMSGEVRVEV